MTLLLGTGALGIIVWILARNNTAHDPASSESENALQGPSPKD